MKEKMGFALLLLSLVIVSVQAETVSLIIHTTDNEKIIETVDRNTAAYTFYDGDSKKYRIKSIDNLDQLPFLESLEFYNIAGMEQYGFLGKIKGLKRLHLASCTVPDLSFLEELENLESVSLNVSFSADHPEAAREGSIDLGRLKKIRFISFYCTEYRKVPRFVNVQNRPFLDIDNNLIRSVDRQSIELLRQYRMVSMKCTPLAGNEAERRKLAGIPVLLDVDDAIPEDIAPYY